MKNKKALVIALSAGLVLGGAFALDSDNVAYAAEGEETPADQTDTNTGEAGDKEVDDNKDKEDDNKDKEDDNKDKEDDNKEKESTDWDNNEDNAGPIFPVPSIDIDIDEEKEEENEDTETVLITSEEVDELIKDIDNRDQEIHKELKRIDSNVVVDDNKKPADDSDADAKPDKDNKDDDTDAKPEKEKVIIKEKEVVKVPAKSHNNPKTGVAGLSAVAGTLAVSMAGIVATRKKND